jgi:hypothetical protein
LTRAAKILAVDDEADFGLLITQRFRRQIREREFAFQGPKQADLRIGVEQSGASVWYF